MERRTKGKVGVKTRLLLGMSGREVGTVLQHKTGPAKSGHRPASSDGGAQERPQGPAAPSRTQ